VIKAKATYPQQVLFEFDLANMSLREGSVLLPKFLFPAQSTQTLRQYNSPYTALPLVAGAGHPLIGTPQAAPFPSLVSGSQERTLQRDWLHAVLRHPATYLHVRWEAWTRLIAWSAPAYEPYHPGIDSNPWNYRPTFLTLDHAASSYLAFFTPAPLAGGLLHRTWIYLLLGPLVGADLLTRRRAVPLRIIGTMCVATVLYYLGYFFLTMGGGFRWGWVVAVAVTVGMLVDVADRLQWPRPLGSVSRTFAAPAAGDRSSTPARSACTSAGLARRRPSDLTTPPP
jgi:hypothetical protein